MFLVFRLRLRLRLAKNLRVPPVVLNKHLLSYQGGKFFTFPPPPISLSPPPDMTGAPKFEKHPVSLLYSVH